MCKALPPGKPQGIEASYFMKSTAEWNRFMRFMAGGIGRPNSFSGFKQLRAPILDESDRFWGHFANTTRSVLGLRLPMRSRLYVRGHFARTI